jgi:hypothetical protein
MTVLKRLIDVDRVGLQRPVSRFLRQDFGHHAESLAQAPWEGWDLADRAFHLELNQPVELHRVLHGELFGEGSVPLNGTGFGLGHNVWARI